MEKALTKYPDAPWDWRLVSSNPSVSFEYIRNNPQLPWVLAYISENASTTEQIVRSNKAFPWDFSRLCSNPNMSFAFFDEFLIKPREMLQVDWCLLSAHPSVDMATVMKYPLYAWDDRYLSANPNLSSNFILNEGNGRNWFAPAICANPGITARDIIRTTLSARVGFEWSYGCLSCNPNLPVAFVKDNLYHDWNYHSISRRAALADVEAYGQVPWDAHGLSMNPNISFKFVKTRGDVAWDLPSLLMNPAIPLSTILDRQSWFYKAWPSASSSPESFMSSNPTVTLEWIEHNRLSVDWKRLSKNPLSTIP